MNIIFFMLLLAPSSDVVTTYVDKVEVNHYYNSDGDLTFDQVIYWKYYPKRINFPKDIDGRFDVLAWRVLKDCRKDYTEELKEWQIAQDLLPFEKRELEFKCKDQVTFEEEQKKLPPEERKKWEPEFIGSPFIPKKDHSTGRYIANFIDTDGTKRRIITDYVYHTYTDVDPETTNRILLPQEKRDGLGNTKKDK